MTNYKNVSLNKKTYSSLIDLSKKILPGVFLSISKVIEFLASEKIKKINRRKERNNSNDK